MVDLLDAVQNGEGAAVVFVVQRPDAETFSPYREVDLVFARALGWAAEGGVKVKAFTCQVFMSRIAIEREIPCIL